MESLFETRKNSDLHFEASNGRCQKVHLCVISTAIPLIDDLLDDKVMIEGVSIYKTESVPRVVFSDFTYDTIQLLIEYTYLGYCSPPNSSVFISLFNLVSKLKYKKFMDFLIGKVTQSGFKDSKSLKEFTSKVMQIEDFPEKDMKNLVNRLFKFEREIDEDIVFKDFKDLADPNRNLLTKHGYNFTCGQNGHSYVTSNGDDTYNNGNQQAYHICNIYLLLLSYDSPELLKIKDMDLFICRDNKPFYNQNNTGNVPPFYGNCGCLNSFRNHKLYKYKDLIKRYPFFKNIDYKKVYSAICQLGECNVYYLYGNLDINEIIVNENKMIEFRENYYYKSE